jgi:hypothetical protein
VHLLWLAKELGDDFLCSATAVGSGSSIPRVSRCNIGGLADDSIWVAELVAADVGRVDVHGLEELGQLDGLGTVDRDLLPLVLDDEVAHEDDLFPRPVRSAPAAVHHGAMVTSCVWQCCQRQRVVARVGLAGLASVHSVQQPGNGEGTEMAEVSDPLTRAEVMRVVNAAANLITEEMGWGDDATPEEDAVNLLVNVFAAMLDNPDITVDEVMDANYAGDGETGAEMVRSWWGWGRPG